MKRTEISVQSVRIPLVSVNTLIIGSGAAGLNTAVSLHENGQKNLAIVTEAMGGGTSFNAGSDKQTYYKISLSGSESDSPVRMAEDLFRGGCMHGDIALIEAQYSLPTFFHLVSLGVPFPHDRYGAFVGYKTDHDPRQRATSAGPLTSRFMGEGLAREVTKRRIPVFDRHTVIALLTDSEADPVRVIGAVGLDQTRTNTPHSGIVLFNAVNIVLATGGPGGLYKASVYPPDQTGSSGLALQIGAVAQNLTESQFGLASVKFRWNLSGTYQQAIPRYFSTDGTGRHPREFLAPFFPDMARLASAVFRKGYEWPFDPGRVRNHGSSLIDLLVYQETVLRKRRVFLDYTRNPGKAGSSGAFHLDDLDPEARSYLENSGALLDTPVARLEKMNPPAIQLYRDHGIDITREPLEIAVCAQHNNGGLKGNIWWESNIRHLFPVGEVNGSHGVHRPGGSALNAGQVGGLRAAAFISRRYGEKPPAASVFMREARNQVNAIYTQALRMMDAGQKDRDRMRADRLEIQERMSRFAAHIRRPDQVRQAAEEAWNHLERLRRTLRVPSPADLPDAFKTLDLCLTHAVYLEAVRTYLEAGGGSRGSYLVPDESGEMLCPDLGDAWRSRPVQSRSRAHTCILEVALNPQRGFQSSWIPVRPIPTGSSWFENVWRAYRNDEIIR
jgi:succinate dehydrogenase/fumarate reductase flavoprotein subunit